MIRIESLRRRKDGSLVDVSILAKDILLGGETVGVYGIYRDISESKKMASALERERALFEQLFSSAPEAIVLCDSGSTILRMNQEFEKLFGYSAQETIGKRVDELLAPLAEGLRAEAASITHQIANGTRIAVETVRRRKDGSLVEVSILGQPIHTDSAQIGVYGIYRDITNRKTIERALVREKAFFEQLFTGAPEAVVLCDNDLKIIRINEEFSRLFGYSGDEVVNRNLDSLVAPTADELQDEASRISKQVSEGTQTFAESLRRRKDGSLVDVSILAQPIFVAGEQVGLYGIYRDITARKEAEEALTNAHAKVELLHDAAGEMESAKSEAAVSEATILAAEAILGFTHCALDMKEDGILVTKALSSGAPVNRWKSVSIPEAGITGEVFKTGKTRVMDMPNVSELMETDVEPIRCLITAPIDVIGIFQAASSVPPAFSEDDVRFLRILLGHTVEAVSRLRLESKLTDQAIRDPLTGVFNRRHFNEVMGSEVRRSKRYDHPLGLLMVDINRFKHINDHYGHHAGDEVLKTIANVLSESVRDTDLIVRYGGDEFLIVLTETGEDANQVGARIREAVATTHTIVDGAEIPTLVSVGTANWNPESDLSVEQALAKADEKMYEDKRRG